MRWLNVMFALALSSAAQAQSGSRLPQFDIDRNCKAESKTTGGLTVGQSVSSCSRDETAAREQLSNQWSKYPADFRRTCSDEASSGSSQSYVELQTCLDMSNEVKRERQR